jgi:hypothetical protein
MDGSLTKFTGILGRIPTYLAGAKLTPLLQIQALNVMKAVWPIIQSTEGPDWG